MFTAYEWDTNLISSCITNNLVTNNNLAYLPITQKVSTREVVILPKSFKFMNSKKTFKLINFERIIAFLKKDFENKVFAYNLKSKYDI